MPLRSGLAALSVLAALPAAAQAHDHRGGVTMPPPLIGPMGWGGGYGSWYGGGWQPSYQVEVPAQTEYRDGPAQEYDRDSWLRECRRRLGDNGVGGALIGGVVGGVAGNVIAGHGDKLVGTVAGAAVGALAGRALDKAEDAPRARDRCEAMLEGGPGYAPYGSAGYGYGMPVMMVPVPQGAPGIGPGQCKKTVTTTTEYVDAPRRSRYIPRRAAPEKRVRLVPDKRVSND